LLALPRLFFLFKKIKPTCVQTWLYHADLLGGVCAKIARVPCIIWTLRNNKLAKDRSRWLTRCIVKVLARLSSLVPHKIVCCANDVLSTHRDLGYASQKMCVIHNGFNISQFQKITDSYAVFRQQHSLSPRQSCIGTLSRYHPDKGIDVILKAMCKVIEVRPETMLVLGGFELTPANEKLMRQIQALQLCSNVLLLGIVKESPQFLSALDVFVSSSLSEGFSNAIGEAMACEVPCIVTDVGDSAFLVASKTWVVPSNDVSSLAQRLLWMLDKESHEMDAIGHQLRERIVQQYSIETIVKKYENLYH